MAFSRYPFHDGFSEEDAFNLVKFSSRHVRLPNPTVVEKVGLEPIFKSLRRGANRGIRFDVWEGTHLLDDNRTPAWALMWPHEFQEYRDGWRLGHIWPDTAKRPDCFTAISNLCLIAAPLERLSDGIGPLVEYLKFHSQDKYCWAPEGSTPVLKPPRYDEIEWTYLEFTGDPLENLKWRFESRKCRRSKILRQLLAKQEKVSNE